MFQASAAQVTKGTLTTYLNSVGLLTSLTFK